MKNLIIFLSLMVIFGCGKEAHTNDVVSNLTISKKLIDADGSTTVDISVTINSKSSTDKRKVVFTSTGGEFIDQKDGKLVIEAVFQNSQLIASATLKAPMSPGTIIITTSPESKLPNQDFILQDSIICVKALPASLHLEPSTFGLGANFTTTDTLIGTLKGPTSKKVSVGSKVNFKDVLVSSGLDAGGSFRSKQVSSDGNSQVKALYSAPNLPIGTNIYLKVISLDENGNETQIRDSVLTTINQ